MRVWWPGFLRNGPINPSLTLFPRSQYGARPGSYQGNFHRLSTLCIPLRYNDLVKPFILGGRFKLASHALHNVPGNGLARTRR